jgi:hypothetical protein
MTAYRPETELTCHVKQGAASSALHGVLLLLCQHCTALEVFITEQVFWFCCTCVVCLCEKLQPCSMSHSAKMVDLPEQHHELLADSRVLAALRRLETDNGSMRSERTAATCMGKDNVLQYMCCCACADI